MADLDKDYFRAVHKSTMSKSDFKAYGGEIFDGVLHGDIERRTWMRKNKTTGEMEPQSRQDWAIRGGTMQTGAGTSIHDESGRMTPPYMWKYFTMPEGTPIPDTLTIVQRGRDPHHYQIEVRTGGELTPDTLRGALDNLARACVARQAELAQ